ncbi:MAG TPA: hypothetical protein VMD09_04215 [Solirubrobacteraceae bacterium]|nr:hypothetical protein [Solirubrobacteraceae bacterium]
MLRITTVLVATTVGLLTVSSLAGGAQTSATRQPSTVTVLAVLGKPVDVPPGQFRKAYAFCPRGYYVTGGGAFSGAITEVASSPTPSLRGWLVDGTNNDPQKRTFSHRADAVCVKGRPPATVGIASGTAALRQAEVDWALSHQVH